MKIKVPTATVCIFFILLFLYLFFLKHRNYKNYRCADYLRCHTRNYKSFAGMESRMREEQRRRLTQSQLDIYFAGQSSVHKDIIETMRCIMTETPNFDQLSETMQDQLLSEPFLEPTLLTIEYPEEKWGEMVVSWWLVSFECVPRIYLAYVAGGFFLIIFETVFICISGSDFLLLLLLLHYL